MEHASKRSLTIQREMFLIGFLFLFSVSMLLSGIVLALLYRNSMDDAKNALRACNSQIVTYTEGMFHENATLLQLLARDKSIIHAATSDPAPVVAIYDSLFERNSNVTYIYSGYEDGSLIINNYPTPQDYNATLRPWYRAAMATDGVARLVYSDAATGDWLFSQCIKLMDQMGDVTGAIAIDCSNESITRQLLTKYQYASQRSFIIDQDGTVLIHPNEVEINRLLSDYMDAPTWNSIVFGQSNYAEYLKDGIKAMSYLERIPETRFFVVTAIDAHEVTEPIISNTFFLLLLITVLSAVLGLLLSRVLIRRFARPIMELGGRIQNLAEGRTDPARDIRFSNAEINGIAQSIEVIVRDIAHREELRKAAEYLSFHDSMTGLYNRRFFEEEIRRLDVKRNEPLCLVCCDVNGLKLANDVFGHAVGDRLIQAVADCLRRGCRVDDILARVGGDEFALILPRTSAADARKVIMRIRAGFPKEPICGAVVSASLGYAAKTGRDQPLDDVLKAADEMMYERKQKESLVMKRRTIQNIIEAAQSEGLVQDLTETETRLLDSFAQALCPESLPLLKESYRLRRIGLCTLVLSYGVAPDAIERRHTEIGYRILSAFDDYRSIAGYVLNYREHWDGSGEPAGLAGRDIPLLSRIMSVTEGYARSGAQVRKGNGILYDPELLELLGKIIEK